MAKAKTTKKAAIPKSEVATVTIDVPVCDHSQVCPRRVDFVLTRRQGEALRLLRSGLAAEGESVRLPGDPPVSRAVDGIRWLLDQIADGAGVE